MNAPESTPQLAAERRESDVRQVVGSDTREDAEELLRRLRAWLVNECGPERAELALPSLETLEARCEAVGDGTARHYTLPSGAVASVRALRGRDLRDACRLVDELSEEERGAPPGTTADAIVYELALVAVRVRVDNRPLTLLALLNRPLGGDIMALLGIMRGKVPSDAERARRSV